MKFLHTGDWHLGKVFYEKSLLEDQEHFLNNLFSLIESSAKTEPYSAICIPGDIYDRSIPSAEAVDLLNSFLVKVHDSFPALKILLLAGNHDSANRLGFAKDILSTANIYICSDTKNFTHPIIIEDTAFYQLPFLYPASLPEKDTFSTRAKSQKELFKQALEEIKERHSKNFSHISSVLCAHTSVFGTDQTDPLHEVGTVDCVPPEYFDTFTYTCLGHIHKMQKVSKSAWYSGSPLAYSFDESKEKYLLSVEIKNNEAIVEKIPVKPLHSVVRLKGAFEDFFSGKQFDAYKDSYIEIVCTDNKIVENPMELLHPKFPNLLSFVRENSVFSSQSQNMQMKRKLFSSQEENPKEIIKLFIQELRDDLSASEKEIEAFMELYKSVKEEENK